MDGNPDVVVVDGQGSPVEDRSNAADEPVYAARETYDMIAMVATAPLPK